jgi:hypothetical protein
VIGAIVLSSLTLSTGEARPTPLTVRLEYAAGASCPDVADFKGAVTARLGYDPFDETAPERVLVHIVPRGSAFDARIEWRDASGNWAGEQAFPSVNTDCPRLVRTMGFALAVHIQLLAKANADPAKRAEADATTAPDGPATNDANQHTPLAPAPTEPIVASGTITAPSPANATRTTFAMGAGPAVGFGISSAPVLLGRLFGAVTWPHAALEIGAGASLPATTRRADGAGFSQQHLLGALAACATATAWNGCALINAGAVHMAGENIDRPTSATVPIVQAGIRGAIDQRLGRRAVVSVHADGLVNLTRWTGRLDQVPVWTAPRFAAALGIAASVEFP